LYFLSFIGLILPIVGFKDHNCQIKAKKATNKNDHDVQYPYLRMKSSHRIVHHESPIIAGDCSHDLSIGVLN